MRNYLTRMTDQVFTNSINKRQQSFRASVQKIYVMHLLSLVDQSNSANGYVSEVSFELDRVILEKLKNEENAHSIFLRQLIENRHTQNMDFKLPQIGNLPPGSPIGCMQ